MTNIHGHEILHYIIENEPNIHQLKEHADKTYGESAKFYTCSQQDLTLNELVQFLDKRGKFIVRDGQMIADPEKMCSHS